MCGGVEPLAWEAAGVPSLLGPRLALMNRSLSGASSPAESTGERVEPLAWEAAGVPSLFGPRLAVTKRSLVGASPPVSLAGERGRLQCRAMCLVPWQLRQRNGQRQSAILWVWERQLRHLSLRASGIRRRPRLLLLAPWVVGPADWGGTSPWRPRTSRQPSSSCGEILRRPRRGTGWPRRR